MGWKSSKAENTLIAGVLLIGGAVWLFQNYPVVSIMLVVVFVLFAILNAKPTKCELCAGALKRTIYTWEIDGRKKRVCPNCNRQLERKKSKEVVSKLRNTL